MSHDVIIMTVIASSSPPVSHVPRCSVLAVLVVLEMALAAQNVRQRASVSAHFCQCPKAGARLLLPLACRGHRSLGAAVTCVSPGLDFAFCPKLQASL
jgi:hypothetical protein